MSTETVIEFEQKIKLLMTEYYEYIMFLFWIFADKFLFNIYIIFQKDIEENNIYNKDSSSK